MEPHDPNEPLPTVPAGEGAREGASAPTPPAQAPASAQPAPPPLPPPAAPPPSWGTASWGAPSWGAPSWGGWPPPPSVPPPLPPRRDRLALGVVAFIFGGLFLVFFGFLVLAYSVVKGETPRIASGPRIGVLQVKGAIGLGDGSVDAETVMKQAKRFETDDSIKAVVVRIDSPGGSVGPSQEIHDEVKRLAEKKAVVCSLGNVAASGGFYVAVACPTIVASPGTLTGSIGVITQFVNVKGLAERFDIKMETVKSGKLKDAGNPFRDMTPEDRVYWQSLIDKVHGQFLRAVAEGRDLEEDEVRRIADGRVLTGAEAKDLGLVDELGNFYDAVELAKQEAKLSGEPQLVYPPDQRGKFLEELLGGAAGAMADAIHARVAKDAQAAQAPGLYFLAR